MVVPDTKIGYTQMKRVLYIIGIVIGLAVGLASCESHMPNSPGNDQLKPPPTIDPPVNELLRKDFNDVHHEAIDAKLQMRTPALRTYEIDKD